MRDSRIVFALISIALVTVGVLMIARQPLDGPRGYGDVVYDTRFYLGMIEHHWPWDAEAPAAVPEPFRFRVLVPWMSSLLPFRSGRSLALVTYASLAVSYFFSMLTCRRLGVGLAASVAGVVSTYASYAHLGLYANPYMTDASGLMVISIMMYAILADWPWIFAGVGLAGIFAREITLLFIPAWSARSLKRGAAMTALAVLALVIEHQIVGRGSASPIVGTGEAGPSPTLAEALVYFSRWRWDTRMSFAREILTSWGWLWLSASVGLVLVPTRWFRPVAVAAAVLAGAGFASLLVAQDVSRLLDVLFPVVAVGTAHVIAMMVEKKQRLWFVGLGVLVVLQFFLSWPSLLRGPRLLLDVAPRLRWIMLFGAALMIAAINTLKHDLRNSVREKSDAMW